jgi:hypothetical protein
MTKPAQPSRACAALGHAVAVQRQGYLMTKALDASAGSVVGLCRTHIETIEMRLLFITERAVELVQRRLHRVQGLHHSI